MNIRKISAALTASLIICSVCTSCGKKKPKSRPDYERKEITADSSDEKNADGEAVVAASSGQAYLEIRDASGDNQYLGNAGENLCYNAAVVTITGNGSYSVSVTANTAGFRTDAGGNPENYNVKPEGLMYAALKVRDGVNTCPGAVLTIDSIEVDGAAIPMNAKNFTFTEDDKDLKSNIYNEWASKIPNGAISAEGNVPDGTPGYSSVIVSKDSFTSWTTVKVNFTVSGM